MTRAISRLTVAALLAGLLVVAPAAVKERAAPAKAAASTGWTTYHYDNARDGNDTSEPAMGGPLIDSWTSPTLDGSVYAEALIYNGLVYVATENNTIYALNEATGTVAWHTHLATPVSSSSLFCGNIGPVVGITGTPVIDTAAGVIYAVGLTSSVNSFGMKYQLYAVNTSDGSAAAAPRDIDYTDLDPRAAGQRSAIALANGKVYVPFGGRAGDCAPYHPIVVAVPTAGGAEIEWDGQNPATQGEAGIWAAGGEAIDASGNVYVVTGNGTSTKSTTPCNNSTWDHGNAIVKLSSSLSQVDFYTPTDWCVLSYFDTDLGGAGPALLNNGYVWAGGKDGKGYLVNGAAMGGFGGPAGVHIPNCQTSDAIFGSFAYDGTKVYVPCDGMGVAALNVNTTTSPGWSVAWEDNLGYSAGPPILAGGYVWALDQGSGTLIRLNPSTAARTTFAVGSHTRFMTPSADGGRIFIAQTNTVRELNFAAGTPPGAPTITSATPGDTYAALTWTAPTSSGSTAITGYRITASNGHAVVYNSTATQQAFPGLTDGTPYTFTVAAENSAGFGPESAPFGPVTPAAPAAAVYHPLTPIRILDTRQSTAFGPSTVRSLKVASANGIPANATSVVVNLAVTNTTANGYFTAYPHGINRPTVSNLNFTAGQTIAVLAQVEVGAFGQIDLYNFAGNADLVVDVAGYFAPPSGAAGLYNPLPPARILDTRPSTKVGLPTTFGPNQVQTLQVTGAGGVPAGASAVVLNVTVGGPTASSYLTLWPSDASRPLASNLNFVAGQVIPNRVYVKLSATGQVSVYNFAGNVDVVVDVAGYFTDGTTLTTGSSFYGRLPQRVIDTRPATQVGPYSSPLGPGGVDVVTGPAGAAAVVASVAVTDTTASSYMTLYPADQSRPTASDLNWTPGVTIANLTVPKLSASNTFDVYNQQGSVDFVVDVNGYYGP